MNKFDGWSQCEKCGMVFVDREKALMETHARFALANACVPIRHFAHAGEDHLSCSICGPPQRTPGWFKWHIKNKHEYISPAGAKRLTRYGIIKK